MVGVGIEEVIEQLSHVNYWWLFVPKVFSVVAHVCRAARWNIVLNSLNYYPGLFNSTAAVLTAYFTNLGLPKLGEIFRCWTLKRTEGVPVKTSIGSVVVERAVDTITLFLLLFTVFILHYDLVGNFIIENIFQALFIKIKTSASGNEIYLYFFGGLMLTTLLVFYLLRKPLKKTKLFEKVRQFLLSIWEGLHALKNMNKRNKWSFLGYTLLIWSFYFIHFELMFYSMSETSNISTLDGFFIFTIRGFGMAAPIQAGIGAYHWIVTEGMSVLGIEESVALAFAIATHASGVIFKIIMGVLAFASVMFTTGKFLLKDRPLKSEENQHPK